MHRSSRANMSPDRCKPFVLTMVVIITIVGLVVAQRKTMDDGDEDRILFPEEIAPKIAKSTPLNGIHETNFSRSLWLAKKINSMKSIAELLNNIQGLPESEKAGFISSRMGDTGERSDARLPEPAICMPELQIVPLQVDNDPSIIYTPSCTRVKRCGGCCSNPLLSCQPVASEFRNFKVIVSSVDAYSIQTYQKKLIVPVEEHTKCTCDCRIKAEHCTEKQSYVQHECRCACNNVDEIEKCSKNDMRIWHPDLCTCTCRDELACSTGFYFDQNTCSCRRIPRTRIWSLPTMGTDYRFGQTQKPDNVHPAIILLDAADPRRKPKEDPER